MNYTFIYFGWKTRCGYTFFEPSVYHNLVVYYMNIDKQYLGVTVAVSITCPGWLMQMTPEQDHKIFVIRLWALRKLMQRQGTPVLSERGGCGVASAVKGIVLLCLIQLNYTIPP